jgi:hypothetical protein
MDDDDGAPLVAQPVQELEQGGLRARVHAGERLVHDEQRRALGQRAARKTRWRWPPESWPIWRSANALIPTRSSASAVASWSSRRSRRSQPTLR